VGGVPAWYVAQYAPRFVPSHGFRDELDRQLDLHWHVLHASCQPDADDDFWAAAEPVELLGVRTRALCPADELLLVTLHGLRWNAIPTYRWVVDATLLCSGALGEIDYERLLEQARKRKVTVALGACLRYLREVADVAIPERALRALRAPSPRVFERAELRALATQPRRRSALQWQAVYHGQALRRELSLGSRATPRRHLRIACARAGVRSPRELARLLLGGEIAGPGRPVAEVGAAVGAGLGATSAPSVSFGETLHFADAELARSCSAYGIWLAEGDGCWVAGREARLELGLAQAASGALVLELSADAYIAVGRPTQRLGVWVNGHAVAELELDATSSIRQEPLIIPAVAVAGQRRLELALHTPDAVSPARLGHEDDDRRIGVFLREALLREPTAVQVGGVVQLGEGSGDGSVLFEGWGEPERRGRWTVGERARMLMRLAGASVKQLDLEFEAAPFLGPVASKLSLELWLNGRRLGRVDYEGVDQDPLAPLQTRMALPSGSVGEDGDVLLEWRLEGARSPRSLGVSSDERALGLFLVYVALLERDGTPAKIF